MRKSHLVKRFFLIGMALFLFAPIVGGAINYSGYCFAEKRFLSKQEGISAAVTYIIERMRAYPRPVTAFSTVYYVEAEEEGRLMPVRVKRWPESILIYDSLDQFYRLNAGCCETVSRGTDGYRPGFWDRVSGRASTLIRVRYSVRFVDVNEMTRIGKIVAYVPVSNCGKVRPST